MALEDAKFSWDNPDDLGDIARVVIRTHIIGQGKTEDFGSARFTVDCHSQDAAKDIKSFLMQKKHIKDLETLPPKLEKLNGRWVVGFSTPSPDLSRLTIEKLGEYDFPHEQIEVACSTLNLDGVATKQQRGVSR